MRMTINKLAEITGKDRRTIKRRVELLTADKTGYESRDALPLIYNVVDSGILLDPQQEAARLNESRRKKVEMEMAVLDGDLCKVDEVEKHWAALITNCKTKLLALPKKLAGRLKATKTLPAAEKVLKTAINEALIELSEDGIPEPAAKKRRQTSRAG